MRRVKCPLPITSFGVVARLVGHLRNGLIGRGLVPHARGMGNEVL